MKLKWRRLTPRVWPPARPDYSRFGSERASDLPPLLLLQRASASPNQGFMRSKCQAASLNSLTARPDHWKCRELQPWPLVFQRERP